jgi:hypothetical protein
VRGTSRLIDWTSTTSHLALGESAGALDALTGDTDVAAVDPREREGPHRVVDLREVGEGRGEILG